MFSAVECLLQTVLFRYQPSELNPSPREGDNNPELIVERRIEDILCEFVTWKGGVERICSETPGPNGEVDYVNNRLPTEVQLLLGMDPTQNTAPSAPTVIKALFDKFPKDACLALLEEKKSPIHFSVWKETSARDFFLKYALPASLGKVVLPIFKRSFIGVAFLVCLCAQCVFFMGCASVVSFKVVAGAILLGAILKYCTSLNTLSPVVSKICKIALWTLFLPTVPFVFTKEIYVDGLYKNIRKVFEGIENKWVNSASKFKKEIFDKYNRNLDDFLTQKIADPDVKKKLNTIRDRLVSSVTWQHEHLRATGGQDPYLNNHFHPTDEGVG